MVNDEKDRLVGEMTWKYIDRMSDPSPNDSAEKILEEFVEEWHKIWFLEKSKSDLSESIPKKLAEAEWEINGKSRDDTDLSEDEIRLLDKLNNPRMYK